MTDFPLWRINGLTLKCELLQAPGRHMVAWTDEQHQNYIKNKK